LGYEPHLGKVVALSPARGEQTYRIVGVHGLGLYRRCENFDSPAGCNWLLPDEAGVNPAQTLCISCRLNRTIPDLSFAENRVLWGRIEVAKRRVISSLVALGLPIASKVSEDVGSGLAFDFLRSPEGGPAIITGHAGGIITLNIEEADDVKREQMRAEMGETYRTLVGHFRHELGHYYWERLIEGRDRLDAFRELFGDERHDYATALAEYHQHGPPHDWPAGFISAYAASHPWEDWAETWAHYLHMVDALGTALSFGFKSGDGDLEFERFTGEMLYQPEHPQAAAFLFFLNSWIELSAVLNELSRSMGQPDSYPFALPKVAVRKLQFVQILVADAASERGIT
jgi:hypothetical protein